ncbi:hypothetical protein Q0F99_17885 [Rathayibacter oskolensis]|uniref:universal stress protein n=1 Tax=Rathayibacter oskolensis TaxID=1891671 RepID=UPI00265FC880|nr:universal stress protein [Rathayibacter oskolensis]WKK71297.1 hypothetical protein Q0F99_17885 [Rathayibacter oskolensis]
MAPDRIVVGAASTREGQFAVDWALRRAERLGLPVVTVHIQEDLAARHRHEPPRAGPRALGERLLVPT